MSIKLLLSLSISILFLISIPAVSAEITWPTLTEWESSASDAYYVDNPSVDLTKSYFFVDDTYVYIKINLRGDYESEYNALGIVLDNSAIYDQTYDYAVSTHRIEGVNNWTDYMTTYEWRKTNRDWDSAIIASSDIAINAQSSSVMFAIPIADFNNAMDFDLYPVIDFRVVSTDGYRNDYWYLDYQGSPFEDRNITDPFNDIRYFSWQKQNSPTAWVDDIMVGSMQIIDFGECTGRINRLVFQYNGDSDSLVEVVQKKSVNHPDGIIFSNTVSPGEYFTVEGDATDGTLWTDIKIYVDSVSHETIRTNCAVDVGRGYIAGDFEVIAGESSKGGPLPHVL
jgi:hypothetical protein